MILSLSVRIAETFHSKEHATLDLPSLARIAQDSGYAALCMRASQIGIHSPPDPLLSASRTLASHHLAVSMVTGNFDLVYNNERGPDCLRNITPFLDLAQALGAPLIRVALRHTDDIPWAQRAADQAADRSLSLVHQCHIQSLFETVEGIESTLLRIDRPNFGLIYEPANLEQCGQDYGPETIRRLSPWIRNVYLQNQRLHPLGSVALDTWCRGAVRFDLLDVPQPGGIDFARVFEGLQQIQYSQAVTVHQSAPQSGTIAEAASATARFLARWLGSGIDIR